MHYWPGIVRRHVVLADALRAAQQAINERILVRMGVHTELWEALDADLLNFEERIEVPHLIGVRAFTEEIDTHGI